MPISDQVIELETKKKGRTALFIVLIAVLAAASAVFAVLWVIKAPAVDPPAIEEINVAYTDLCQTNKVSDANETESYLVAPSCRYTMYFDVVLKNEGDLSTVENTNSVLSFTTDPDGMITIFDTNGLDPENPKRYKFEFRLTDRAANSVGFKLMVTSKFTPEVNKIINFELEKTYAETLDITKDENEGKTLSGRTSGKKYELSLQDDDSTPEKKVYKIASKLPYYEAPLTGLNEKYVLSFEALGKLGTNGNNAKITLNALGTDANGRQGKSDQIQVFVADKANPADSDYLEIIDDKLNEREQRTRTKNLTLDLNPSSDYCRSFLYFEANDGAGTCVSTIKLVANSFIENAPKLEVIIEVNFESSDNFNRMTEIKFNDPYKVRSGSVNEINLYLESFSQSNPFVVSDYITAVVGGQEVTDPDKLWGTNGLVAYVTTETGSTTIPANERCIMSTISSGGAKFTIAPVGNKKTGVGYITILDSDPDGFGAMLRITVNVCAPITDVAVRGDGDTTGKEAVVSTYAGREASFKTFYTLHREHSTEDDIKTVNTKLTVEYPAGVAKPRYDGNKLLNADDTIVIDGMSESKGEISVSPKLTLANLAPTLEFTVGKKIKPGNYKLTFTLDSQALKDGVAEAPKTFTVTVNVIDLAGQIRVDEDYSLATPDKFTKIEMGELDESSADATVTVATGTGTKSGNNSYTSFVLTDLLKFYSKNDKDEFVEVSENIAQINKAVLKVESLDKAVALNTVLKGGVASGELIVPTANRDNCRLLITLGDFEMTLTLVYKLPVLNLAFDDEHDYYNSDFDLTNNRGFKTEYYNFGKSDEALGAILANGAYDKIHAVTPSGNKTALDELIDGDKFNMDIAVLRNKTAWTLLPKKLITVENNNGNKDTTTYYYYPYTDVSKITNENYKEYEKYALFRTGYASPLQNSNLTVLKDLYSLGYLDTHDYDYQNIRIYFSYGDDVIKLNNRDVVSGIVTGGEQWEIDGNKVTVGDYVMYANYRLMRTVDDVLVFEDNSYSVDKIVENHIIRTASGTSFPVYYSEIINIIDYSKIFTAQEYKDNFLPAPSALSQINGNNCVITANNVKSRNIAYEKAKYSAAADSSNSSSTINPVADSNPQYGTVRFLATCSPGPDADCQIRIEVEFSKTTILKIVTVQVSNNSLEIDTIELFDESGNPVSDIVMYKNSGNAVTVKFRYRVTYSVYNEQGRFDKFNCSLSSGVDYVTSPTFFNFEDLNECRGLPMENGKYYYDGAAEITIANANNGTHVFEIKGEGNSVAKSRMLTVRVTTLLQVGDFKAEVEGANVVNSDGNTASDNAIFFIKQDTVNPGSSAPSIVYNYDATTSNTVKFAFNFDIAGVGKVDTQNLTYVAKFGDNSDFTGSGAIGSFYTAIPTNLGAVVESEDTAPRVVGFSLNFTGERIDNKLLEIIFTETNPGTNEQKVYHLYVNITVNIPVSQAELTITPDSGDTSMKKNADGTYTFTTDGSSADKYYTLSGVLNGGVANKQPVAASAQYNITDAQGNALTSEFCEISGTNSDILTVKNGLKKNGVVYLVMTVTDSATGSSKEATVALKFETSVNYIEFKNTVFTGGNGKYTFGTENNAAIDCSATVKNFGTNSDVAPQPNVTYRIAEGAIDGVSLGADGRVTFTKDVNNAEFTVIAQSGDLKLEVKISVYVPVKSIAVTKDGITLGNTVNLIAGETAYVFNAVAENSNGITPAFPEVKARLEDGKEDVVGLSVNNGEISVTPLKEGVAKITVYVEKESVAKEITVNVSSAGISVSTDKTTYDVSTDSVVSITLNVTGIDASRLRNLKVVRDSEDADTVVAGLSGVNISAAGRTYTVSIDKSKLTAASMGAHTVYVSADYNGKHFGASCTFNLIMGANAYVPEIEITSGGYSMENQKDSDGNYILVNTGTLYTFNLKTPPAGYESYSVEYGSDQFEFVASNINSPVKDRIGGFKVDYVGKASVRVTVTVLGQIYTATMDNLMIVDSESSKITSSVYYSDSDSVEVGTNGAITGVTQVVSTNPVYIDYEGKAENDYTKVITFVAEYTNAYYLKNASGITVDSFKVNAPAELRLISARLLSGNNRYYYVASYYAVKTGDVSLMASTVAVGGVVYTTDSVSVSIRAHEPAFNRATGTIELNPGEEKSSTGIILNSDGFKGSVEYSVTYPYNLIESASYNGTTFTVKAKNAVGGTATVHVSARVTSGACTGVIIGFDMTVNIESASAPTVTANNITNVKQGAAVDLNNALQVVAGSGDNDFAYTAVFKRGNAEITNGNFVAPNIADVITIDYTVTVTEGFFKDCTFTGSFTVTVVPTANISLSATVISPVKPLTLGVTISGINSGDYSVFYTVSDINAGTFNGNSFTPANGYAGNVKFTAHINVTGGIYAGANYEIESSEVAVAGLTSTSELSGAPGGKDITLAFSHAGTVNIQSSDPCITANGATLEIAYDANTGSANKTVILKVTVTDNGIEYYGEFEFKVTPKSLPALDAAQGSPSDNEFTVTNPIVGAQYKAEIVSGSEFVSNPDAYKDFAEYSSGELKYTFNKRTDTKGGTVVVKVNMLLGGAYGNITGEKEFRFTVTGEDAPELGALGHDPAAKTITASVDKNTAVYEFVLTNGSEYITLGTAQDGTVTYSFVKFATAAGVKATVTVYATVDSGNYIGTVLNKSIDIDVPVVELTLTKTDNATEKSIAASVTNSYNATYDFTLSGDTDYVKLTRSSDSKYTYEFVKFAKQGENKSVTVTVTATFDNGYVLTKTETVSVPAETAPALDVDVSEQGKIKAAVKTDSDAYDGEVRYEFTVAQADKAYINIDSLGNYTFVYGAGMPQTITVTVKATILSGTYAGTELSSSESITVTEAPELTFADNPLKFDAGSTTEGTFDYTDDSSLNVLYFSSDSQYISVLSGNRFLLKPDTQAHNGEEVTVHYYVTDGLYKGNFLTQVLSVNIAAVVPTFDVAVIEPTEDAVMLRAEIGGGYIAEYGCEIPEAYRDYIATEVTRDASGKFAEIAVKHQNPAGTVEREIDVKITATITNTNGAHDGEVKEFTVKVTVKLSALELDVDTAEEGKIKASVNMNGEYKGEVSYGYTVEAGKESFININQADGTYTFVYGENMPEKIKVTVSATVTSGIYQSDTPITKEVEITVTPNPEETPEVTE